MDIVLIGSGNVATHLGLTLQQRGHRILQVYSRTLDHAEKLSASLQAQATREEGSIGEGQKPAVTEHVGALDPTAHIYMIAVSDQAIGSVISELPLDLQGIVVHTSGSTPMSIFQDYSGENGVFYPVQTFSRAKSLDFRQVPLALEASSEDTYSILAGLATDLSDRVFPCDSSQRLSIHIAAVFACNFTNFLYTVGEQVLQAEGLDLDLIRPLIQETADKIQLHQPHTVQTGPAHRNDQVIVQRHLEFLAAKEDPRLQELYALISSLITQKAL